MRAASATAVRKSESSSWKWSSYIASCGPFRLVPPDFGHSVDSDAKPVSCDSSKPNKPLLLAIESSCDETAAAVVDDQLVVHSSVVASQFDLHERFGGVVPEIASRA